MNQNTSNTFLSLDNVTVSYEGTPVISRVSMNCAPRSITALIGPRESGKTSLLMACCRLLELNPAGSCDGQILLQGSDTRSMRAEHVRRRLSYIGSRPICFPRSIWDNVAWGARINGFSGDYSALVEDSLQRAGLWNEVRNMLRRSALRLSGGQKQRLALARALAVEPDGLLLDKPTIRLDPIATGRIEDVLIALKDQLSIVFATHDPLQAGRIAEDTAVILPGQSGYGELVEMGRTEDILLNPQDRRTEDYITGKHLNNSRYRP